MILLLFFGIAMDRFGRKWLLFSMAILNALATAFVPIVSPNQMAYCALIVAESMA